MPTARTDLGTAVVKGKVFAIGGGNYSIDGAPHTNEMYDPATDAWTTKASMPTNKSSFGIAVYQNKIYCIGGSTSEGATGAARALPLHVWLISLVNIKFNLCFSL